MSTEFHDVMVSGEDVVLKSHDRCLGLKQESIRSIAVQNAEQSYLWFNAWIGGPNSAYAPTAEETLTCKVINYGEVRNPHPEEHQGSLEVIEPIQLWGSTYQELHAPAGMVLQFFSVSNPEGGEDPWVTSVAGAVVEFGAAT